MSVAAGSGVLWGLMWATVPVSMGTGDVSARAGHAGFTCAVVGARYPGHVPYHLPLTM